MKKIYLLTAMLFAASGLFAQYITEPKCEPYQLHKLLNEEPNKVQQRVSGSRAIVYKNIKYLHESYNKPSAIWEVKDSVYLTYNNDALLTERLLLAYSSGTWSPSTRKTNTYLPSGKRLSILDETRVNHLGVLRNVEQQTWTYDGNENQLQFLHQRWDTVSAAWVNYQRNTKTYDGQNHVTGSVSQNWSTGTNSWVNSYNIHSYTYDANNNWLTYTVQDWVSGAWQNAYRNTDTYNAQNKVVLSIVEDWNTGNSTWINASKYEYTYDGNGNNTVFWIFNWNSSSSAWDNVQRQTSTFNAQNFITLLLFEDWISGAWQNATKVQATYDGNNNQILEESFNWNTGNSMWRPVVRFTNTYDSNNSNDYHLFEYYNTTDMAYDLKDRYYYTWQQFTVASLSELKDELKASVCPNPSAGSRAVLTFHSIAASSVVINTYDLQGRLLVQQTTPTDKGANQIHLATESIAAGTYYVQVLDFTSQQSSVLKLVKE